MVDCLPSNLSEFKPQFHQEKVKDIHGHVSGSDPLKKKKKLNWRYSLVVECLPSVYKALGSGLQQTTLHTQKCFSTIIMIVTVFLTKIKT
jgi:acid phosphatase family membrane protein YuiD